MKKQLYSSSKFTDDDAADLNFMSVIPDRQWNAKGTSSGTRAGLIMTTGGSRDRSASMLTKALVSMKDQSHDTFEFDCLSTAEFGKASSFHHQLMRGYFVSGTTDVEITTENLRAAGEEEYLIPRRKESLTECDVDKSFAKHRFTLLICENWRATEALHGG